MITKDQADWAIDTLEECLKESGAGQVLDVGCGINKYPGAIGIDRIAGTRADVLCDLDRFPYPFADASFDEVRAVHVIEHVSDVITHDGGIPSSFPHGRGSVHRHAALHGFQFFLRSDAPLAPEQLFACATSAPITPDSATIHAPDFVRNRCT